MKGLIIVNQNHEHTVNKVNRLLKEAKKLNIGLDTCVNDGTLAHLDKRGNIVTSINADFVIYLDKDIYLLKMLEEAGIKVFHGSYFLKLCDDKTLTYLSLVGEDIRIPLTYSAPLIFADELKEDNLLFIDKVIKDLGLPLIGKKVYGSLGEGVYLLKNKEEVISFYKKHFKEPLQFQEYIKSSKGRSIRVLVIDHKIFGAFERFNKDDFRSNFSDSASGEEFSLPKEYEEVINKLIKKLDIKYAGIDLLFGEDGPVLCEINSNAFFDVFERITKKNAAKEYLLMILKELKHE